jgi:hypothetical protein
MKKLLIFLVPVFLISAYSQKPASEKDLFDLYKAKQFTSLEKKNNRSSEHYFFYKASYFNVSNQPTVSVQYLDSLEKTGVPQKIEFEYWGLKADNYVKLFDYKNAALSTRYLIDHYPDKFTDNEKLEAENSYRIWEVLSDIPPQKVLPFQPVLIPATRDIAGLINLKVSINGVDGDFVFDTGAGISCITDAQAEKMGVKILPDNHIQVKGYNGIANEVRMGIAPLLKFGGIEIENALFLVFKEEALSFANGAYKINGIIGFPIAKDLGTITLGKETLGFEKMTTDVSIDEKNLFIELLTPILFLKYKNDLLPFGFDTGADRSNFSKAFYTKYKSDLKKEDKPAKFKEGSAGGTTFYKGIKMKEVNFFLGNQEILLTDMIVHIDNYHPSGKELFGNIGQDILKQYSSVIISFDNNYLRLVK